MGIVNPQELKQFIIDSIPSSYAAGDKAIKVKENNGSTTITFTKGKYTIHDNYFGGEPYGGREVVFLNDKPIWMMVYYGFVQRDTEIRGVYSFLKKALLKASEDFPFRGPQLFQEEEWKYENIWNDNQSRFSGAEKIFINGSCVYKGSYAGGLIDIERG